MKNNVRWWVFCLFFQLFFGHAIKSCLHELDSFKELLAFVQDEQEALWIFDIDNTLLVACDDSFSEREFFEGLQQLVAQGIPRDQAKRIQVQKNAEYQYRAPVLRTDDTIFLLKDELAKVGAHCIALTARTPVAGLIAATFRQLHELNLEFDQPEGLWSGWYVFHEVGADTFYGQGVLFADGQDKGLVLEAFLNSVGYMPKHIYFIDDSLSNLKAVAAMAARLGIAYDGFCFFKGRELSGLGNQELQRRTSTTSMQAAVV